MNTAEEWAKRLGTTVMTEEEFIQLRDRMLGKGDKGGLTSMFARAVDDMSPSEIYELVAERKARGEGLVGVVPPSTGPDDIDANDSRFQKPGPPRPSRVHRQKMRLVFVKPDPNPEMDDPHAVTFTPDDAIAQARKQHSYAMRVHPVGPVTDIKAALMTDQEARALIEHGTPPGRPGTTPGALVVLVVIYGTFEIVSPYGRDRRQSTTEPSEPTPRPSMVAYQIHDSRNGQVYWAGARKGDIVLPE